MERSCARLSRGGERIDQQRLDEFRVAATDRAQALKRLAGGKRGEAPRAIGRAIKLLEKAAREFEAAVELCRDSDQCALEGGLLGRLAEVEDHHITRLKYGEVNTPFREELVRLHQAPHRGLHRHEYERPLGEGQVDRRG